MNHMILRGLFIFLLLFDAFLAYKFVWGNHGYICYLDKCQYKQELINTLNQLEADSYQMSRQIRLLKKESTLLEKEIRCRLHYARPDEILYMRFKK